jgi:hypothetical protein
MEAPALFPLQKFAMLHVNIVQMMFRKKKHLQQFDAIKVMAIQPIS